MLSNVASERVKAVRALAKRPVRARTGRFLVEGPQGVREAVRFAASRIVDLYATQDAARRYESDVIDPARAQGVRVHEVTPAVLAAMADAQTPQGLVAVVRSSPVTLDEVLASSPRRLVLLAHVRDPGNLGTIVRAADATGADAVLISTDSVDPTSPKAVRSTAGSIFHVPVVTGLPLAATLATLAAHGIRTYAADGAGDRGPVDVALDVAHCWVMGNEAWGLAEPVRSSCDAVVRVPIYGRAESLNLAMAATVCLYASAGVFAPR